MAWRENGAGKAHMETWNCTALELPQLLPAAIAVLGRDSDTEQGHCCPYPHCPLPALPLAISQASGPLFAFLSATTTPLHISKSRVTKG